MRSNQNRIVVKLLEISRVLLGNRTIQLVGLVIAVLTLIVTVAPNEVRILIGLEKANNQSPLPRLDEPKVFYGPFEYTVREHQPQFVKDAQISLSVVFQKIQGESFVSLNTSPVGEKTSVRAVLNGYTEEFKSSAGVFNVQVLNIDYDSKKVVLQINRKLEQLGSESD
ncbi:MAG: hypothetical protein D3910_10435 [Candidatus Electrothrix sp. ATG2]|nr:hypothetical protein [Candidatus Electrothrix sp. ATG2]